MMLVLLSWLVLAMPATVLSAQEPGSWQAEWEKTLDAARKEGRVNVYIDYSASAVIDSGAFQKAYPEIKLSSVALRDSQVRVLAERRAGKYIPDVNIAGITQNYPDLYNAGALDPVKPALLLPEVVDESKWWLGRHRYADPEGRYVFIFLGFPQEGSFRYNTKLVNPAGFRSLWDFVNPKWRGKIIVRDPLARGPGGGALRFFYNHPELGPEYIRRLYGAMNATFFRDQRQAMDWLATGKFALCMGCGGTERAKAQGLPVDDFGLMKEGAGLVAQYGTVALLSRSPSPNAAKVFVNWLLARDGQLALQKALARGSESEAPDSFRIDIPKDHVARANRRIDGVRYVEMFTPERMDMRPIIKVASEAMAQAAAGK